jgi:hypothetical protein
MQTRNPLLDDLAKVLGGAMGTMGGMRESVEGRIKDRLAQLLAGMDLPSREEFEAIKEMAAKARAGEEALAARVTQLEARCAALEAARPAVAPAPAEPETAENQPTEIGG